MALKKSQLYSSLWQSCDELRGGMDASQYKDYVRAGRLQRDKYARVDPPQVKATIIRSAEFKSYSSSRSRHLRRVAQHSRAAPLGIAVNALPKTVIRTLSEDLLARFADLALLDRYDVYQRLMDYWDAVMQDDVYLIARRLGRGCQTARLSSRTRKRRSKRRPISPSSARSTRWT